MRNKIVVTKYWLSYYLREFFCRNKFKLIKFAVAFIVGIVIGIIVAIDAVNLIKEPSTGISVNIIEQMKIGQFSIGATFSKFFLFMLFGILTAFFARFVRFLRIMPFLIALMLGYQLGGAIIYCTAQSVFSGVVCILAVFFPSYLTALCACAIAYCYTGENSSSCGNSISAVCAKELLKKCATVLMLGLGVLIIFALLMPTVIKMIIVI